MVVVAVSLSHYGIHLAYFFYLDLLHLDYSCMPKWVRQRFHFCFTLVKLHHLMVELVTEITIAKEASLIFDGGVIMSKKHFFIRSNPIERILTLLKF